MAKKRSMILLAVVFGFLTITVIFLIFDNTKNNSDNEEVLLLTANELGVIVDEILPGVFNVSVDKEKALAMIPGLKTEDGLKLYINEEESLDLVFNKKSNAFFKPSVQGLTADIITDAHVGYPGIAAGIKDAVIENNKSDEVNNKDYVKAADLDVIIEKVVPGVFNIKIEYDKAKSFFPELEKNALILEINNKELELIYNEDFDRFLITAVQDVLEEDINNAQVRVVN